MVLLNGAGGAGGRRPGRRVPPHSRRAIYRFDRMRSAGRSRYGQVVRNAVAPSIVLFSFIDQPLANPGASAFRGAARTLEPLVGENIPLVTMPTSWPL